ncbi:hypothetical protein BLOT_011921 [Blomia tropicalis]|nr:hypothetical protein BLOT_011921 [Blomia tropicalis]
MCYLNEVELEWESLLMILLESVSPLSPSCPNEWNLPPSPRTLFIACLCRDSCKYFRLTLGILPSCSNLARARRRFMIRLYCFAFTYNGSSSQSDEPVIG